MHLVLKIIFSLMGALFLGYGILLLEKAWDISKLRKLYLTTPVRRIGQAEGTVMKIRGYVEPFSETLQGPFSGKACLYYKYQVMKRNPGGSMRSILKESREVPFLIRDISGAAAVYPAKGRFIVSHQSYSGDALTEEGKEKLKNLLSLREIKNFKHYQIMEEHLELNDEVTVMGGPLEKGERLAMGSHKNLPLLVVRCSDAAFVMLYSRVFIRLLLTSFCFLVSAAMDFHLLCAF